ncbi:hypothetical protein [Phenylobacterium sp.]|uniref:hypothetical protein n=1 Tax=Phenylobacterium sp. TaxID=1871053 RepID=UPI00271597DA|nr:hypothetical protein [Phenylobacterium sp.]MDO8799766.1 hypothetical protein [Phenylobacterium sp.]
MAVTGNYVITPQTPKSGVAVCTTANSTYSDTPANTQKLLTAGPNGARVTKITAMARATNTATELQLYVSYDAGTTKKLINSVLMAAYTVAQTTGQIATDFGYSEDLPMVLLAGAELYVAIGVSNTGVVFAAEWGDY